MGRLLLVRHGETTWSEEGRAQGHSDPVLGEVGRWQVKRLAARLASRPIDGAFSSDLARARETASLLLEGRECRLHVLPALRELHYGEWEGMTYEEIQHRYPDHYARLMTADTAFAPPGGESVRDLLARMSGVEEQLCGAARNDSDIVVVAHGGPIRVLLVLLLGLPLDAFWRFTIAPASLSALAVYAGGATLDLWNDTGHLEEWNVSGDAGGCGLWLRRERQGSSWESRHDA